MTQRIEAVAMVPAADHAVFGRLTAALAGIATKHAQSMSSTLSSPGAPSVPSTGRAPTPGTPTSGGMLAELRGDSAPVLQPAATRPAGIIGGVAAAVPPRPSNSPQSAATADDMAATWRVVLGPDDPAKAAANMKKLLVAPQALAIAPRFLVQPGHMDVVALTVESSPQHRNTLLSQVRATLLERLAKYDTDSPPDTDVGVAPAAFARFTALGLIEPAEAVALVRSMLRRMGTRTAGVAILGQLAVEASAARRAGKPLTAFEAFAELDEELADAAPSASYEMTFISTRLGWRPRTARFEQVAQWPIDDAADLSGASHLRCTYNAAHDVLFTTDNRGLVVWSSHNGAATPRVLCPTHSFVSVDLSAKGDAAAAVSAPDGDQGPALHIFTTRSASRGTKTTADSTLVLEGADTSTCVKCVTSRSAAFCVAVTSEGAHGLRLYSAGGALTRTTSSAHDDYITCLATSPENDNMLLSGSRDATVKCWDVRNQKHAHVLQKHSNTISSVAVVRDTILTASFDQQLCTWDARRLDQPTDCVVFGSPLLSMACTARGAIAVSTLQSLSLVALHPLRVQDAVGGVCYRDVAMTPNGKTLFAVGNDAATATVDVFRVDTDAE